MPAPEMSTLYSFMHLTVVQLMYSVQVFYL
jgi:hypothetical protein